MSSSRRQLASFEEDDLNNKNKRSIPEQDLNNFSTNTLPMKPVAPVIKMD